MTRVRLTATISEENMVKLRIVAARNHLSPSRMATLWIERRLANVHITEPPYLTQGSLDWLTPDERLPY